MQSWTKNKKIVTHFKRTTVNDSIRTGWIPIPIHCFVNTAQSQMLFVLCIIRKVGSGPYWIKTGNTNDMDIVWYPDWISEDFFCNYDSNAMWTMSIFANNRENFVVVFLRWKGKCLLGFQLITFLRIYLIKWLDIKCTADGGYRWHCYQTKLMKNFLLLAS